MKTKKIVEKIIVKNFNDEKLSVDQANKLLEFVNKKSDVELLALLSEASDDPKPHWTKRPGSILGAQGVGVSLASQIALTDPNKNWRLFAKVGMAIGLLAMASNVYQFYLSKAAKACKGEKAKISCMYQFKIKALEESTKVLKNGINKCKKDKDPEACKVKILEKIERNERAIDVLKINAKYYKGPKFLY